MIETFEDRRQRRAQAMLRACQPDRGWAEASEPERHYWLAAAQAVEASDAAAGIQPIPLEGPYGRQRSAGTRGLGAHVPALAAMYEQAGIDVGPASRSDAAASPEIEDLGPDAPESGLPPVVRAVLALIAFAACAAGLLAAGYYLANGIG